MVTLGAFRKFKDYCFELNIIQDWYNYKEEKYNNIASKMRKEK